MDGSCEAIVFAREKLSSIETLLYARIRGSDQRISVIVDESELDMFINPGEEFWWSSEYIYLTDRANLPVRKVNQISNAPEIKRVV